MLNRLFYFWSQRNTPPPHSNKNAFANIPYDVLCYLFGFLDLEGLKQMRLTATRFKQATEPVIKAKCNEFYFNYIRQRRLDLNSDKEAKTALEHIHFLLKINHSLNSDQEKKRFFILLSTLTVMLNEILKFLADENIVSYSLFKGEDLQEASSYLGPYGPKVAVELSGPVNDHDLQNLRNNLNKFIFIEETAAENPDNDYIESLADVMLNMHYSKKFNEERSLPHTIQNLFHSAKPIDFKKLIQNCINHLNQGIGRLEASYNKITPRR